jgi:hypothetical protein
MITSTRRADKVKRNIKPRHKPISLSGHQTRRSGTQIEGVVATALTKFYSEGLGLGADGIIRQEFEHGSTVVFHLEGGNLLALYARGDIGHDAGALPNSPSVTTCPMKLRSAG